MSPTVTPSKRPSRERDEGRHSNTKRVAPKARTCFPALNVYVVDVEDKKERCCLVARAVTCEERESTGRVRGSPGYSLFLADRNP